jgi:integrase/recombinase XerD
MLFDWLIIGQVIDANPAHAVRAPKYVVRKGKTPVLIASEARQLLDSIPLKIGPEPKEGEPDNRPPSLIGLRDRALIAVMVFSFARVSAALGMKVEDYYTQGRRAWFRLHEKGGKRHEVAANHKAADYLEAYLTAAGIAAEPKTPLFRSIDRHRTLTARPMHRIDAFRMIKRRAKAVGLPGGWPGQSLRAPVAKACDFGARRDWLRPLEPHVASNSKSGTYVRLVP